MVKIKMLKRLFNHHGRAILNNTCIIELSYSQFPNKYEDLRNSSFTFDKMWSTFPEVIYQYLDIIMGLNSKNINQVKERIINIL